ncbi:MAG: hypothetical protein ABR543_10230 [Gemmatimonadaceae bacterium]
MFRKGRRNDLPSWKWRHEVELPPEPHRAAEVEDNIDDAWHALQLLHSSFRATEQKDYRELVEGLQDTERLFLGSTELATYYDECNQPVGKPIEGRAYATPKSRHVAAIQAQFMEDVYFVLQLSRYPNALDNQGWMNLFRGWGQSVTFNAHFDALRPTLAAEFAEFYELYIREYPGPIDEFPVPHPWDAASRRRDPRKAIGSRALRRAEFREYLPGVYLDSGIREAGHDSQTWAAPLKPSIEGSHGMLDPKGGDMSYEDAAVEKAPGTSGPSGSTKE